MPSSEAALQLSLQQPPHSKSFKGLDCNKEVL